MKTLSKAVLSVLLLIGIGSTAWAQNETDGEKVEDVESAVELKEVTVTASPLHLDSPTSTGSRLDLTVMETPASIHIVDNAAMKNKGYLGINEALDDMPGVTSGLPPGDPSAFSMRGFTGNQISVLRDGIWLGPANMSGRPQNTFNLDRLELLKGPASVLHGQGAISGTINAITKRPAPELGKNVEFLGSIARYDTYHVGGGGGAPLSDQLWVRMDFSQYSSDGFVDDADPRSFNGTGSLLWKPGPRFDATLSFDYLEDDLQNYWGTPLVPKGFASEALTDAVETADGRTVDGRMRFKNYNVGNGLAESDQYLGRLDLHWKPADAVTVRNTFFYFYAERDWANSESYLFNPESGLIERDRFFVGHEQDTYGNRLDLILSGEFSGMTNQALFGVDYTFVDFERKSRFFGGVDGVDPFSPESGTFEVPPQKFVNPTEIETVALYFEDTLKFPWGLRLVGGARYDHIDLDRDSFRLDGSFNPDNSFTRKFEPFSWRIGAVVDVIPSVSLYGQWSSGADPVDENIFLVGAGQNFDLTEAQQFEIGVKSSFWDRRAEITGAFYFIERKDILVQVGPEQVDTVGKQESIGFELEGLVAVTRHWTLRGNVGYTDAEFKRFGEFSGNEPPNVPEWIINAETRYRDIAGIPVEIGAGLRFVDDRFTDNANTITLRNYTLADVHVSYVTKATRLTARIRNLFDEDYANWGDPFYPDQVLLGSPRTFEFGAQVSF